MNELLRQLPKNDTISTWDPAQENQDNQGEMGVHRDLGSLLMSTKISSLQQMQVTLVLVYAFFKKMSKEWVVW